MATRAENEGARVPDLSTVQGVRWVKCEISRLLSELPWVQLSLRQSYQLGGKLFAEGSHFVALVAQEAERQVPGYCDPRGVGAGLRVRHERVEALRSLWTWMEFLTDQVRSHYLLEQAALIDDATSVCQATLARDPFFPSMQAAKRVLDKKLERWKKRMDLRKRKPSTVGAGSAEELLRGMAAAARH